MRERELEIKFAAEKARAKNDHHRLLLRRAERVDGEAVCDAVQMKSKMEILKMLTDLRAQGLDDKFIAHHFPQSRQFMEGPLFQPPTGETQLAFNELDEFEKKQAARPAKKKKAVKKPKDDGE